jgi:hypothetical protein
MWRHNHVQEHSPDYLLALMVQNKMFANVIKTFNHHYFKLLILKNSRLITNLQYAISPQHSGVFHLYFI